MLEKFWTLGHKAARAFNKYPLDGSAEEKIEAILLINEFDFDAVGDAYGAIEICSILCDDFDIPYIFKQDSINRRNCVAET